MDDAAPLLPLYWARGYGRSLTNIQNNMTWLNAFFKHSHFWMFTASTKQTWRLHFIISHFFPYPIHDRIPIHLIKFFLFIFNFLLIFWIFFLLLFRFFFILPPIINLSKI